MMGGMKMKRKDLDEVNDDFSGFSLSSPATKIRRLDAELLPIVEEEDSDSFPSEYSYSPCGDSSVPAAAEENEERAIVVFNPTTPFLQSPSPSTSSFGVYVDPHLISGFRSQYPWQGTDKWSCMVEARQDREEEKEATPTPTQTEQCKAVVPWVPSQLGSETMDIDEDQTRNGSDDCIGGLHQWQQQHCMIPYHLPYHTPSTPITWST